jgi:hypothetical protein
MSLERSHPLSSHKEELPKIIQDPNYDTRIYLDCPGFSDNRGAEINIANSLNINRILQNATGVKAVFLAEYIELFASRGSNLRALEDMCLQMFGGTENRGIDNLRRHKNAIYLGITKAPRLIDDEPVTLDSIRSFLAESDSPVITNTRQPRLFLRPAKCGGKRFR